MNEARILIITDEPIFSFGLQVQFNNWRFAQVEIVNNCQLALQGIQDKLPSLTIIDEKLLQERAGSSSLALIARLEATAIIVLGVNEARIRAARGIWEMNQNYTCLSKPCKVEDLRAAVESLLQINLVT